LTRLTESIVKVVGIQSRLEAASYDAGEIFWDRRIANLSGSEYHRLDVFTPFEEDPKGSKTPDIFNEIMGDSNMKARSSDIESTRATSKTGDKGLLAELSMQTKQENFETRDDLFQQPKFATEYPTVSPICMNEENSNIESDMNQATTTNESNEFRQQFQRSDKTSSSSMDIEDVIAQAKIDARPREVNRRTAFLIIAVPAAVVGLLVLENLTGIISKSLFGG
jgi:hypothetical protein